MELLELSMRKRFPSMCREWRLMNWNFSSHFHGSHPTLLLSFSSFVVWTDVFLNMWACHTFYTVSWRVIRGKSVSCLLILGACSVSFMGILSLSLSGSSVFLTRWLCGKSLLHLAMDLNSMTYSPFKMITELVSYVSGYQIPCQHWKSEDLSC